MTGRAAPRVHPAFARRRRTRVYLLGMSDNIPDPYLAETGFDADEWTEQPSEVVDQVEDELEIEEDRAHEA